jgi:uncharacterized membrane protein YoaK (UPF0700 family)
MARVSIPSANSPTVRVLLIVLSVTAGCTDVLGLLTLSGMFTAHITGNLVILAAHVVTGSEARVSEMLSVPVFIVVVALMRVFATGLESIGLGSLRPLLLLQALLLAGFAVLRAAAGLHIDPNVPFVVLGAMMAVAAMAVQNALVQISLKGAPTTAVMTTNVTHFSIDAGKVLLGDDPDEVAKARDSVRRVLPVLIGFPVGCALGAAGQALLGLTALWMPAGLAVLAFSIGCAGRADDEPHEAAEPAIN